MQKVCSKRSHNAKRQRDTLFEKLLRVGLISFGLFLLAISLPSLAFALASAEFAIREICGYIQGSLGALLMTAAGVGAVISGAFGNLRASISFIIVGIGGFTVSSLLGLYFPNAGTMCEQGAAGGGAGGQGGGNQGGGGGAGPPGGGAPPGGGGGGVPVPIQPPNPFAPPGI